jgi:hypothetical protein
MPNICVLAMCVLTLAGCAASPNPCARVGGARMLEYQLFFARGSVSEHAWTDFNAGVVTPHLPDGFTVVDADGQWMNPATHRISSERTKVMVVAVPDTPATVAAMNDIHDTTCASASMSSVGSRPASGKRRAM